MIENACIALRVRCYNALSDFSACESKIQYRTFSEKKGVDPYESRRSFQRADELASAALSNRLTRYLSSDSRKSGHAAVTMN